MTGSVSPTMAPVIQCLYKFSITFVAPPAERSFVHIRRPRFNRDQYIRDLQVHVPPSLTDTCQLRSLSRKRGGVSISGRSQPVAILSAWWLLPDTNQPSGDPFFENTDLNDSSYQKQSLNTAKPKRQSPVTSISNRAGLSRPCSQYDGSTHHQGRKP